MSDPQKPSRDPEDPELVRLILEALERQEDGRADGTTEVDFDDVCRERPDLIDQVRAALGAADRLPGLHKASGSFDPFKGRVLLDRYHLQERVGAGSMGVVYRASDAELQRDVAVKILRSDLLTGPEFEARFEREAEVLASIRHRGVVAVHDRGQTEDQVRFLVMEMLEGTSMSDLLEAGVERQDPSSPRGRPAEWLRDVLGDAVVTERTDTRQFVAWAAALAEALSAVHERGVLHRDVKPSNMFVRVDGAPVLLDFGVAAASAQETVSDRKGAVGTLAYMAPEQAEGAPLGPTVDVYGLGASLYHMLTLVPPYSGAPAELLATKARRDPPAAERVRPGLPRDLCAILGKSMARAPKDRYATAREFANDLNAFLEHRPVRARPVSALRRGWRRLRRAPAFQGAAAVALVVGLWVAWSVVTEARAADRQAAFDAHWASMPPTLLIAPPPIRASMPDSARAPYAQRLDRLVALSDRPVPARFLRAVFRWDRQEFAAAAADLASIGRALDSPWFSALSERCASTDSESVGQDAVVREMRQFDLDGLPAPVSAEERYAAALITLRSGQADGIVRAAELLDDRTRSLDCAGELAILVDFQSRAMAGTRLVENARLMHDRVLEFQVEFGQPSAASLKYLGISLQLQHRMREAYSVLRRALELAPSDFGVLATLSHVCLEVDQVDEAEVSAREALRLAPGSLQARRSVAVALALRERFVEAIEFVSGLETSSSSSALGAQRGLLAYVEVAAALASHRRDQDRSDQLAESALAHLDEAVAAGASDLPYERIIARAILGRDDGGLLIALVRDLAANPTNVRRIRNTSQLFRGPLGEDATAAVRDFMTSLADQLAPDLATK